MPRKLFGLTDGTYTQAPPNGHPDPRSFSPPLTDVHLESLLPFRGTPISQDFRDHFTFREKPVSGDSRRWSGVTNWNKGGANAADFKMAQPRRCDRVCISPPTDDGGFSESRDIDASQTSRNDVRVFLLRQEVAADGNRPLRKASD
jgi:hypothetical protein